MGINIEWTLNIGTITATAFTLAGAYWVMRYDVKAMKDGMKDLTQDLKKLNEVVTDLAVQDKRLDNQDEHITSLTKQVALLEGRVYELSHGEGFVQRAVDGEWPKR
jgi:hypothetical protein